MEALPEPAQGTLRPLSAWLERMTVITEAIFWPFLPAHLLLLLLSRSVLHCHPPLHWSLHLGSPGVIIRGGAAPQLV